MTTLNESVESLTYYASNDSLGEYSESECEAFRLYASLFLTLKFPNADITVSPNQSSIEVDFELSEDEEAGDAEYILAECREIFDDFNKLSAQQFNHYVAMAQ